MSQPSPLVQHLQQLAHREDRGALATLRRALGHPPGAVPATFAHVAPFIPEWDNRDGRDWPYFLVASLFALHPAPGAHGDMGWTCQQLGAHESAVKRFEVLLGATNVSLPVHLRQVVSLARSSKRAVPIDWDLLLRHLRHWESPDRWVQRRWARSYWSPRTADAAGTDASNET